MKNFDVLLVGWDHLEIGGAFKSERGHLTGEFMKTMLPGGNKK